MFFKAIAFTLVSLTLSSSVSDFTNKFCDNTSMKHMIDRVFQTPTTIYMIRNYLVYPIIRKEMPLIVGHNYFWTQKRDAFHIKYLFLDTDLYNFESGFTITLDRNKNFIRDFTHKPHYYYLTFIFSKQNYYIYKELSNNSFVLANRSDIPLSLENQGSIRNVFGIEAPIYGSDYKIFKTSFDPEMKPEYVFVAILLSNNNMFYSFALQKTDEQITVLKGQTNETLRIDQNYRKYKAYNITGIVRINVPYIVLENSLVHLYFMQSLSRSERFSIWEEFDCNYFNDYLPQIEEYYKSVTTIRTTTPESTIIIETKQQIFYWPTIIVLTLIFLFFGIIIFFPLLAFKKTKKNSKQIDL